MSANLLDLPAVWTDAERWRAVEARDRRADGAFVYAVRTTGVYCRPSCPARRPKRENVGFFETPEGAEAAGYRACRRCHPTEVGRVAAAVARTQLRLDEAGEAPALAVLASEVGLSPFHLQRAFKAALGVSPKQYALRVRAERLKRGLRGGEGVTAALFEAGHPSGRTLYDPATDQLGMTPGAYRRGGTGQEIRVAVSPTPLGAMLVAATERGLCAVWFGEEAELRAALRAEYPRARLVEDDGSLDGVAGDIRAHLAGRQPALNAALDAPGTAFQRQVWAALRAIPAGETRTYAQLAAMIGQPSAVRAVARACATNPVAVIVPCHRVVRAGGGLAGYRWGVERKRALLAVEAGAGAGGPGLGLEEP